MILRSLALPRQEGTRSTPARGVQRKTPGEPLTVGQVVGVGGRAADWRGEDAGKGSGEDGAKEGSEAHLGGDRLNWWGCVLNGLN